MKTIVVPTDFSAPAENAMFFAGHLAEAMNVSILLLHVYQIPVSINEVPVLIIPIEQLKEVADTELGKAKESLQKKFPSLQINTESRLGDVSDELNETCTTCDPLAVVIGKHSTSGIERLLFGNTSMSIIRHSSTPVIVVPDKSDRRQLKNLALAIDTTSETLPYKTIDSFITTLQAQLHIVHVYTDKTGPLDSSKWITPHHSNFTNLRDEDFVHGIQTFVESNQIDMLIMLPHKHSLVERLFFKTHTKELMEKISIPMMCIPEV